MPQIKVTDKVMDNAKRMGDDLFKIGRNVWLAGLGAVALAEEETRGAFDKLVDRGEEFKNSERNVVGKAVTEATEGVREVGKTVEGRVQDTMKAVLNRAGVPSGDEIRTLIDRVEQLTEKVDAMGAGN